MRGRAGHRMAVAGRTVRSDCVDSFPYDSNAFPVKWWEMAAMDNRANAVQTRTRKGRGLW